MRRPLLLLLAVAVLLLVPACTSDGTANPVYVPPAASGGRIP